MIENLDTIKELRKELKIIDSKLYKLTTSHHANKDEISNLLEERDSLMETIILLKSF